MYSTERSMATTNNVVYEYKDLIKSDNMNIMSLMENSRAQSHWGVKLYQDVIDKGVKMAK